MPGFQLLNWLMPKHIEIPEAYYLILAMVLGQPVKNLPENVKFDMDSVWNYVFGGPVSDASYSELASKVHLSGDAMMTILCMVSKLRSDLRFWLFMSSSSSSPFRFGQC